MARKITWMLMLLLLASVQMFASVCATRCAIMSMPTQLPAVEHAMAGMEHCTGMMATSSMHHSDLDEVQAFQSCTHDICKEDLSVAKDHATVNQTDAVLHILTDASMSAISNVLPISVAQNWRPPTKSGTRIRSKFIPLLSNLRV